MGLCMREDLETKYSRIRDFCKKEKKQFWQKISARIPHSVCLKVGNVDRIAIWSGSLGLTRAHSGSLGLTRAHSGSLGMLVFRINFSKFSAL